MKSIGKQIIVIDNGFVHVGDCFWRGDMLQIENCKNIRKWGTTQGLGQLRSGPLAETVADECGTVVVPKGRVVFFIHVTGGW